jgi:hypothetical protein
VNGVRVPIPGCLRSLGEGVSLTQNERRSNNIRDIQKRLMGSMGEPGGRGGTGDECGFVDGGPTAEVDKDGVRRHGLDSGGAD